MLEKIFDGLKEMSSKDIPFIRKNRLLRYVACIIILFLEFCDSYWNLLAYVDLPCAPLVQEKYRATLHSAGIIVLIVWIVYIALFHNLFSIINGKYWMILSYLGCLIDFIFTMFFLVYALNIGIEFVNGLQIQIKTEFILSFIYLLYCVVVKSYISFKIKYEQNHKEYTNYCDSEGNKIPVDAKVFYKGKGYNVEKCAEGYEILSCGEKNTSSQWIKLEDAASDMEGKLLVQK